MKVAAEAEPGTRHRLGYWHNAGGESSAAVHVNEDGTVTVSRGVVPISAARAPRWAMMVAEVLGIPFEQCGRWSRTHRDRVQHVDRRLAA